MRLHSATLRNYRQHRELTIEFDPERSLIGGPNESGKSTVVEAIHRVLFLKARGNTEDHRAMKSTIHGGQPEVELTFAEGGTTHRVHKKFGSGGTTTFATTGAATLSDDQGEAELANVLGVEGGLGGKAMKAQWGHLWIWQGQAGADPCAHATEQRDGLMQRLQEKGGAGALQSDLDARVAAFFAEQRAAWYVQGDKPKAGSELEKATKAAEEAEDRWTEAAERVQRLEQAVRELEQATRTLNETTVTLEALEVQRKANEAKMQQVTELTQLQKDHAREEAERAQRLKQLEDGNKAIIGARRDLADLEEQVKPLGAAVKEAEAAMTEERAAANRLEQEERVAAENARSARQQHEWALAGVTLLEKEEELAKLKDRQGKIAQRREALAVLEGELAKLPALEKAKLGKIQKAEIEWSKAEAALAAMATGLELESTGVMVKMAGEVMASGERKVLTEDTLVEVGEGVRLRIQPGGGTSLGEARKTAVETKRALEAMLDEMGLKAVHEAVECLARRDELKSQIKAGHAELEGMGADDLPEELATAERAVTAAKGSVERLSEWARGTPTPTDKAEAKALAENLREALKAAENAEKSARAARDASTSLLTAADAKWTAKKDALEGEERTRAGLVAKLDLLRQTHGEDEARNNELVNRQAAFEASVARHRETRAKLEQLQPDLVAGDQTRIDRALRTDTEKRDMARTQRAAAEALLKSDGREDPQEALATAEAQRTAAKELLASVQRRADAIRLLDDLFRNEQTTLSEQFTRPLAEKISGYLQCLFGAGARAEVRLEDNDFCGLQLTRPALGNQAFEFDKLSGGAKEQVAAAVRLAMAEVLASAHDGNLPMVFDDAFAYSDPERVEKLQRMLDLAATRGLQIIVLSCNPSDYSALGAKNISLKASTV